MQDKIIEAFKKLKEQLDVRDYDDERFIKDLPENEPVSLVIPFERTARGYLDIFRSYIGGDEHPELSDEELLEHYLQTPKGKEDAWWGKGLQNEKVIQASYNSTFFRGFIEENESKEDSGKHRNRFSEEEVVKLIKSLKGKGINAVEKQDKKSQDPSTVVVMDNGIITPFMDKKTISSIMPQIKKAMSECNFAVGGHIAPITFEQLRSPMKEEETSEKRDFAYNFIHEFSKQPSIELSEIKNLEQLTASSEKIKFSESSNLRFLDEENNKNGNTYVWRGGVLGDKAFIANVDTESQEAHVLRKSWAMATPSIRYALRYSQRDPDVHFGKEGFGFLYQYNTSGHEVYFQDRGLERAPTTFIVPGEKEVPLFANKNSLENIFLCYVPDWDKKEVYLMRLDPNNPEHQKLLKLYEAKDTRITGNLKQRRINQFNEATENGGKPLSYTAQFKKENRSATIMQRLSKGMEEGKNKDPSMVQQATVSSKQSQH